jgi:hypothetical protein
MTSMGMNVHRDVDNLITLYRSNSDLHLGLVDYLYFKILNCSPVEYYNISDAEFIEDNELNFMQEQFEKYEGTFLNKTLSNENEEFVEILREESIRGGFIKKCEFSPDKFVESSARFDSSFIVKNLLLYYRREC